MTTIADIRARIRKDLRDEEAAAYRWSDEELDRHIDRAVRAYSNYAPLHQRTLLSTVAGSRWLDLTGLVGLIRVVRVEYPIGLYPPAYAPFSAWGTGLLLLIDEEPDGREAEIYWFKVHTLDTSGSTVPAHHEDLIATGAAAYAALAWASFATNRVNVGGEAVDRKSVV